jgi:hypothetical protein
MRTLVVGIALPHVSFDNYSFISAPAFSEYQRLIVDTAAVSSVVEQVAAGEGQHRNFAGQIVQNGPSTAAAFSLRDLLQMRRREAEWFLQRGGIAVCLAHPDVAHPGVADAGEWRRYSWLPAPQGFEYAEHLLPGFGKPGPVVCDPDHPFAPFVTEFAPRLAYRATVDETAANFGDYARVFARSQGGAAIAIELVVDGGRIILVPPLVDPQVDRGKVAQSLFECVERFAAKQGIVGPES